MKTEIDTFDEWYKSEYPLDYEHYVNEQDIGLFTKLYLRCFASWKASASREGYKLVPIEPTKAMQQSAFDVYEVCDYKNYHLNSGTEVRDMIYKAMIQAVEK